MISKCSYFASIKTKLKVCQKEEKNRRTKNKRIYICKD